MDNAIGLYMEGIRDGNAKEAITKYAGARYTQHSAGVKDGIEGFLEFFDGFLARTPVRDIRIMRGIEEGTYVFVHAYQYLNNGTAQWVTTDIFDTDENDKLIEHWDVISAYEQETASGHTMIDGGTEITDMEKTTENKEIVRNFLVDVLQEGNYQNLSRYISSEKYIQHNPKIKDGIESIAEYLQSMKDKGITFKYDNIFKLIGQGNFVVSYCQVTYGHKKLAVFDIFRLENGLIVEHWDNMEEILPKELWGNSGKF